MKPQGSDAPRKASPRTAVYLFDRDLKWALNGARIADSLGVGSHVHLVTSKYDDAGIQEECRPLGMKIISEALAARIPLAISKDDKMQTVSQPFVVVVARAAGEAMEPCPAPTLDAARRHAQGLLEGDQGASKVTVLEKDTYSPLGSVERSDGLWRPAQSFPLRRTAWH